MNYNFTSTGHVENLTKGQGHVAYQSMRIVGLNKYMVFSLL